MKNHWLAEGLLAHVVVSKYVDHLPLYRLERIFLRQGVDLSRTTLCGWVADIVTALTPIGDELRRQVTAATYLQTDDTPVTILEEPSAAAGKGRLWTYLDPIGRQVVFDATPTHERDGPAGIPRVLCRGSAGGCLHRLRRALRNRAHAGNWLLGPRASGLRRGAHHRRARRADGRA